jgi:general secretion pathway protein D
MVVTAQNAEAEFFSGYKEWPFVKGINYREVEETSGIGVTGKTRYYIDVDTKLEDVGTKLKVTPQINEDNTVTLRIHIEESISREKCAEVPFWNPAAGEDNKGALVDYSVDVKEMNNIDTIITVPKDYTLALGGLVNEENRREEEKVPFLGDIPLLGFFFKDQREIKERNEMIFLLTPHVMMNPLEVDKTSKKVLRSTWRTSK